eukprot:CAMPEP_0183432818 /NCGR_PEP_ID=MMETSP0370-20130417/59723_1 /TAXON_ID=268820 /ORGANISM="Peridinium aciculiferum, Strain PAER-2" /LENGTH=45 /DNA_ID= /DNA_START= /DNA_END= /DNA_ORIENTATION=
MSLNIKHATHWSPPTFKRRLANCFLVNFLALDSSAGFSTDSSFSS